MVYEIDQFYGVYLLYSLNPKNFGKTYVGFTVDPNRRVKQHNRGSKAGGAKKTSGRGPWDMVLIVHGFPNQISALRFEWAWQNPSISRRLKNLPQKKKTEKVYDYNVRLMYSMLTVAPWCFLPLTVQWLKQEYFRHNPSDVVPPKHMPICYGPIIIKKKPKITSSKLSAGEIKTEFKGQLCNLCWKTLESDSVAVGCPLTNCTMVSHVLCLARHFLAGSDSLIPVLGSCPRCKLEILWGQIIRKKTGCYDSFADSDNVSPGDSVDSGTDNNTESVNSENSDDECS